MNQQEVQLKRIQDKLQLLLKQHTVLDRENQKLKEELELVKQVTADQKKRIDDLRQEVSVAKMSAGEMNETDKKEFEKRLNGYIREIDRCIAMMGE